MKQNINAFIFARGGSKGIPKKNIRDLAGKPLIAYSIESALQCKRVDRVIVSTDDKEIADIAVQFGAEVPFMRPQNLALDNTAEWLAWRHAIQEVQKESPWGKKDIFVSLPPTSPFRSDDDINKCIDTFIDNDVDVVITAKNASRHPSFNMIRFDDEGYAKLLMPVKNCIIRRQDAPPAFDMTTVAYLSWPNFILEKNSIFEGKIKAVIIPDERALDIDSEMDFQFAEFLITKLET